MSFFAGGPGRHNTAAPGFSQAHDPFANLSGGNYDDDAVDFEDTYDGLGDQLDESGDAFNDDTFGGGGGAGAGAGKVGTDFDFFGQTASVATAIEEENFRFNRQAPVTKSAAAAAPTQPPVASYYGSAVQSRPIRTGYEKYMEPEEPVNDLEVDRSIWGIAAPKKPAPAPAPPTPTPAKKFMTLEEVEAAMAKKPAPQHAELQQPTRPRPEEQDFLYARPAPPAQPQSYQSHDQAQAVPSHGHPQVTILQRPQQPAKQPTPSPGAPSPLPSQTQPHQQPSTYPGQSAQSMPSGYPAQPMQPTQILQNPNRLSGDGSRMSTPGHRTHRSQASLSHIMQAAAPQLSNMSEEEKAAFLDQETRRAKRNHKIHQLSRDNGLMTPSDKNFVTRIQLQQLISATGNPIEPGADGNLSEDFYYQVLSQIRGTQRQNPSQPLNNFAQTYLFQTGNRQGTRRQGRTAENHVQRMEQQVQRAVEAAKNKPKNPQLVIAGSLGKISFSNAKTPKPLLNIKRQESNTGDRPGSARRHEGTLDRKSILRNIERVYDTLMRMEDHARSMPPPPNGPDDEEFEAKHQVWLREVQALNGKLWAALKVHEPIGATAVHPFIAFLSFSKGKKAIPRVFRHVSYEQRTTILTMIVLHLDQLDVVRGAQITDDSIALNAAMRENIELFSLAVMPSLFNYLSETELDIVTGVLGLITKLNVDLIAKTRTGTSMLTLILSRAELLKQGGGGNPQLWTEWDQTFDSFFNTIEGSLPFIFPASINSGEDVYVWQFLAAMGVSSNPEQQQRLVLAVKDRVLGTVAHAKTLPASMSKTRLANVNLFMRSIGLDVDLL